MARKSKWVWDHDPFVAPMVGDGPRARRLTRAMRQVEVVGLKTGKVERQQVADRIALVEARYHDWHERKST